MSLLRKLSGPWQRDWPSGILRSLYKVIAITICTFISFSLSVLSNKLEAPMLSSIIAALSQEIIPQGNLKYQQFAVVYVSMYVCL